MRSRRTANEQAAEVARRRLELLSAELAAIRPDPVQPPSRSGRDGSGEPPAPDVPAAAAGDVGDPSGRPGRHALRPVGRAVSLGGWLEDRLPASLQGRVRIGAAHLAALAVLVAAVMAALAWSTVRAGDPGDLVPARSVTDGTPALVTPAVPAGLPSQSGSAPPGSESPSGSPSAEVVVDVAGKVRRPGIVRLPVGARVVDAVEAAGGPRRGVDLSSLNLARVLVDGEQVVVGVPAPGGVAASAASSPGAGGGPPGALVNINSATQTELETLPGIGPVTAQAILQWRTDNGAFSAVDELMEVSGIGEATLADMAPFVTV
ncbi:MAG: helix-hairpin-helix domain-containing protein [Nocardioides sp.]